MGARCPQCKKGAAEELVRDGEVRTFCRECRSGYLGSAEEWAAEYFKCKASKAQGKAWLARAKKRADALGVRHNIKEEDL